MQSSIKCLIAEINPFEEVFPCFFICLDPLLPIKYQDIACGGLVKRNTPHRVKNDGVRVKIYIQNISIDLGVLLWESMNVDLLSLVI